MIDTNFEIEQGSVIVRSVQISETVKEGDKEVCFIYVSCKTKYIQVNSWGGSDILHFYIDSTESSIRLDETKDKEDSTRVTLNDFDEEWTLAGVASYKDYIHLTLIKGFLI